MYVLSSRKYFNSRKYLLLQGLSLSKPIDQLPLFALQLGDHPLGLSLPLCLLL